jgi:hypothetical protein
MEARRAAPGLFLCPPRRPAKILSTMIIDVGTAWRTNPGRRISIDSGRKHILFCSAAFYRYS